ncbi:MAG TPA: metal ABC transporter ATP-binding protein [Polyangia bacterium]|nr:metal ABC transporter ATP-binding protein [Polyangia bacterium]
MNLVELRQVVVGYHHEPLLPAIDLALAPGAFLGVVGPNGSGKTTIIRTMLGLNQPLSGSIVFPARRRPRFGYVPQRASVDLTFPLTAFEVTLMGRYGLIGPGRQPKARDHERARTALTDVGCDDLSGRPFHALSGGQRQRVLVARALASEPEILVLDEPTTGMDLPSERAMLDLVSSFTSRQIAVVMVSHQLGAVSDYALELALVPGPGQHVEIGSRKEILTSARLTRIYGRPIAVRSVDGHAVIFVEHECDTGPVEKV